MTRIPQPGDAAGVGEAPGKRHADAARSNTCAALNAGADEFTEEGSW
jgi:hypothetical protein